MNYRVTKTKRGAIQIEKKSWYWPFWRVAHGAILEIWQLDLIADCFSSTEIKCASVTFVQKWRK